MKNEKKNVLAGIDVDRIVKESIRLSPVTQAEALSEAFVAEQKPFSQVSERISQKAKDAHTQLYKEAGEP